MFKALLLQSWHNLSAPGLEKQIDRPNKDKEGNSTQDPEADYNVKQGSDGNRKTTYGFKAHINVDEDGFIKAIAFTEAMYMTPIILQNYSVATSRPCTQTTPTKAESMMNGLKSMASTIA